MKKIYYSTIPESITDHEYLHIPIKNSKNIFSTENIFSSCPAWNHQNSRTFTVYASSNFHIQYDIESNQLHSNTLTQSEFDDCIGIGPLWNGDLCTIQIIKLFSNFYWTNHKNIWISVLPHPLTSLNNNFYHCGAWFNISNWPRVINIGAIMVDKTKPIIIKRGDPLYNIKFHTDDQNDKFDLIYTKLDEVEFKKSAKRNYFVQHRNHSEGFDYQKIIFESKNNSGKCPFKFFWNK